ncbi:MAG: primosomal protein N' [bacterium]
MYAKVALRIKSENLYTYNIPEELETFVEIGKRVLVPLRNREVVGWLIEKCETKDYEKEIKDIIAILDDEPLISPPLISLCSWISSYYLTSFGDALSLLIPPSLSFKVVKWLELKSFKGLELEKRAKKQSEILSLLSLKKKILIDELKKIIKTPNPSVKILKEKGLIDIKFRIKKPPMVDIERETLPQEAPLFPNKKQEYAISKICSSLNEKRFNTFLLYGITGSGKTEVYLQVIQKAIENNGSAIVLVPEISLTPQMINRFKARFGNRSAILHSRLTGKERLIEWQRIRMGEASIVVGARSALFAPARNLRLIIVDEEQSTSYKQESNPRYNARDLAIMRAKIENCACVLGSATPSLESFYNANTKYGLLHLPNRIEKRPLAEVEIVDMRSEKKDAIFSKRLIDAIFYTLKENGQIILLLNRRGYSNFLMCYDCGFIPGCPNCDITLTFHLADKSLKCHYCGYRRRAFDICPKCKGSRLKFSGFGTQRIENEIKSLFPSARILRMDIDTTKKRGSHNEILSRFERNEADILVGTQMISKGLDFPNVLLVGVISSDVSLSFPDFRAGEKTFSLLTQVAGRCGRGIREGRVIIQTYNPGHYVIQTAVHQNYSLFYKEEIKYRKELLYPPFSRLLSLVLLSEDEKAASDACHFLFNCLSSNNDDGVIILGPAPYFIPKIKKQYRFQILLKDRDYKKLQTLLSKTLSSFKLPSNVSLIKDMDPVGIV